MNNSVTGQRIHLIFDVKDDSIFREGEVIHIVDNPFCLGESSVLDDRNIQKLQLLEVLIRKRRVLLENFKRGLS